MIIFEKDQLPLGIQARNLTLNFIDIMNQDFGRGIKYENKCEIKYNI